MIELTEIARSRSSLLVRWSPCPRLDEDGVVEEEDDGVRQRQPAGVAEVLPVAVSAA